MSFPRYPKYKDSGVDWLGSIPAHWGVSQSRRLFALRNERALGSDLQLTASQKHGIVYQSDFMELEGQRVVQVIKGADILKHVEPEDFVISMRSFQGGIERSKSRGSISSAYVMLVPSRRVHGPFYGYLLKSLKYIQALQTTSNLVRDGQALRFDNFTKVDLPIVPEDEQKAISAFLERETQKIDQLVLEQQTLMDLLKEKRQAVISHAVTRGLNPSAPMRPSGFEWLGDVPENWEVKPLGYMCSKIGSGKTPLGGAESYQDEGVPFIRSQNVYDEGLFLDDVVYIAESTDAEMSWSRVCPGDILLNITGASLGRTCLVPEGFGRANVNQHVCIVRLIDEGLTQYVAMVLKSSWMKAQFDVAQNGAAREGLNYSQISRLVLAIPPTTEQTTITIALHKQIHEFDTLSAEAQTAIDLLQERRIALIAAAVTGQIDVRGLVGPAAA